MPRTHTPADALQAKKDVARARTEFLELQGKIADAKETLEQLETNQHGRVALNLQEERRSVMLHLEDEYAKLMQTLRREHETLLKQKAIVVDEVRRGIATLNMFRSEIMEHKERTNEVLLKSVDKALSDNVRSLYERYNSLNTNVDLYEARHSALEDEIAILNNKKNSIEEEYKKTLSNNEIANQELQKALANLQEVLAGLDELERRERDVTVKEKRIDPEYQKIYFSPHKDRRAFIKKK